MGNCCSTHKGASVKAAPAILGKSYIYLPTHYHCAPTQAANILFLLIKRPYLQQFFVKGNLYWRKVSGPDGFKHSYDEG
jgi:hypothetical protein